MLKITPSGDYILRPAPLVSISHTPLRNRAGNLGCNYSITLNGAIVVPPNTSVGNRLSYILSQQNKIRELFARDGTPCSLFGMDGATEKVSCRFYPNVVSIDFQEGIYTDLCNYTVNLEAPFLFDSNNNILPEGLVGSFNSIKYNTDRENFNKNPNQSGLSSFIADWGGVVEDFTDSWSVDIDDSYFNTRNIYTPNTTHAVYDSESDIFSPKVYRLTRNISAIGKTFYASGSNGVERYEGYDQAYGFIKATLLASGGKFHTTAGNQTYALYPGFRSDADLTSQNNLYSSGLMNIPNYYRGFNHLRSVNFDKSAGSCSVTESWILASGDTALENYTVSIDSSRENPRKNAKINGSIKGLSSLAASGYSHNILTDPPYSGALSKYFQITNNGHFGINSIIYQRIKNLASGIKLNAQPLSISLSTNELAGEISYSLEFDNRPLNYFSGVLYENISINDTYPGDLYVTIPVIGRTAGPVIQYIRSRTEYKRDVTIELLLDHTDISYASGIDNSNRAKLLLNKPSLNTTPTQPIRTQLRDLLLALSPSGDPNVTKWYLNPPQEVWSPKEGRYSLNLNWNYEKNK